MELSKIRVLPPEVVNKIAAGEVVERPASVVKELIENSIDAQATKIEIEVKDGGQKLIEVIDNGVGMTRADAIMAFTPHATSKINSEQDLSNITTLGFRGEALASIASVARVELVTKHESSTEATKVQIEGGKIINVESVAFSKGTRIAVKNLFYNVPVRKKFLKSISTEMAYISDIVCHYMMAYPEISFRFTKNNMPITYSIGSGNLIDPIISVYGPEVANHLIPIKNPQLAQNTGITISGFISKPDYTRPSNRYMTTLVNRRFVKSKLINQAITKAISTFLPKDQYPVLILDIRINPDKVDVNVHPQKLEVRFSDERLIFASVYDAIYQSISNLQIPVNNSANSLNIMQNNKNEISFSDRLGATVILSQSQFSNNSILNEDKNENFQNGNINVVNSTANTQPNTRLSDLNNFKVYEVSDSEHHGSHSIGVLNLFERINSLIDPQILGQFHNTFIIGEDKNGMFVIDQHVAHERILFDMLKKAYMKSKILSQPLLFPVPLKLLPSERLALKEHLSELENLGFVVTLDDDGIYYATAVPIIGDKPMEQNTIHEILANVLGSFESKSFNEIKEELLKNIACKSAIKAGENLKEQEMKALLEQLLKTDNPFTCPHGRPIILRIAKKIFEQAFLRT